LKIQSLSVVVPNKKCINNCAFCVSKMHTEEYPNMLDGNLPFYDLYQEDYIRRLEFARDNGCNTVMLTGNSEPQQNRMFLQTFGTLNKQLSKPFRWIEMQTTGVLLDEPYLRFLRNHVWVSTISLSMSSFDNEINCKYNGTPEKYKVNIEELCRSIKKYDFNLRISINMTDAFNNYSPEEIFRHVKSLGADQATFRILYTSGLDTAQDRWINEHAADKAVIDAVKDYVLKNGRPLEILEFGAIKYSVNEISTVIDDDCMSTIEKESLKYLILRENCKLYSKWDDKGSLIF
jgi:sulfatase maturation enzyme AslB (radical SAM superfamily)